MKYHLCEFATAEAVVVQKVIVEGHSFGVGVVLGQAEFVAVGAAREVGDEHGGRLQVGTLQRGSGFTFLVTVGAPLNTGDEHGG